MPQKETGSVFIGKCPKCGDELVVGWLRDEIPSFSPEDVEKGKVKQKISTKDVNDLSKDKLVCTCGNISAQFDTTKGRAVFTWQTEEPVVGNVNLH